MEQELRCGITRAEFLGILARSERLEETTLDAARVAHTVSTWPEYDPDALALLVDGRVVGAGGLRAVAPNLAVLWMASCVDVAPYKFLFMRHAKKLLKQAKQAGLRVIVTTSLGAPKAKNPPEHLGMIRVGEKNDHALYLIT